MSSIVQTGNPPLLDGINVVLSYTFASILKYLHQSEFTSLLHSKNIHSVNLHQTQVTISVASLNLISWVAGIETKLNQLATLLNQRIPEMKIILLT
jgi:hypothetical protein